MRSLRLLSCTAALLACTTSSAWSDVPTEMTVQGRFTDSSGTPLADTALEIHFAIYDTQILGSQLWPSPGTLESHNIETDALGLWHARVGSVIPLTEGAFADTSRWLQVVITSDQGLLDLPRVKLNTGPFVFRAAWSQRADTADAVVGLVPGPYLPLAGGQMSGAITNVGNPPITMGHGNFGVNNTNSGQGANVAGEDNAATGDYSTVGGGSVNHADSVWTTIGGGANNTTSASGATIGGGGYNDARGTWSVIAGGGGPNPIDSNIASGEASSVGGGRRNVSSGHYATVSGGLYSSATGQGSVVAGGIANSASFTLSTVSGGSDNVASGLEAVVGGGSYNLASGQGSCVAGGSFNQATGTESTVSGGSTNRATNTFSTVGGGVYNTARGQFAVVSGGGGFGFPADGDTNVASGDWSTIPGGSGNVAIGKYSLAAGRKAVANHDGSFVWADSTNSIFATSKAKEFAIRAGGGLRLQANDPGYAAFINNDNNGDGIRAYATVSKGFNWGAIYAVNSGTSPAIYGSTGGDTAAYFVGDLVVTGMIHKLGGGFTIDHPLDPQNKYLNHSFVESPDMKNVYDGVVVLDANGEAWVELPQWFEALNRDFRYQLTCIGGYSPVYVSEEISGNRFQIAGGRANLKVSWQVTGIRQDASAEAHRLAVEEPKPAKERGRFLDPEAFGQTKGEGIGRTDQMK